MFLIRLSQKSLALETFNCRDMYDEWTVELKAMADRIISMRKQLFDALQARGKTYGLSS